MALLYGIHDREGRGIVPPGGWCLDLVAISEKPQPTDYAALRGDINWIVRLSWGYGSAGTIPLPGQYQEFANGCAEYVFKSNGANVFIVSNEPNHENERPNGVYITPAQYVDCFIKCRDAIKHARPQAQVLPAPCAPYHADPVNWLDYWREMLNLIADNGGCDGIPFHAYTRSSNPADITDPAKMGPPLETQYSGFLTYQDALGAVPLKLGYLPAYGTEFNENLPKGWDDANTGVVQAAYAEIDEWNKLEGRSPIQCLILYRWPKFADRWYIEGKRGVVADFQAAVGRGYTSPIALDSTGVKSMPDTTYLPSISHDAPSSTLPPRKIDPRLTQRGTTIQEASVSPGTSYFRLNEAQFFDHTQAGGRHHVYVEAVDERGAPLANIPFTFSWPSGKAQIVTNGKSGFDAANQPFSEGRNAFNVAPADSLGDVVKGIGMGEDDPGGWNAGEHTSTLLRFQRVSEHEQTPSTPKTAYVAAQSGLNLRSAPGTDSQLLLAAPYGDAVQVIGTSDNTTWSNVIYQGQTGWMLSSLLSPTPPASNKPQPPAGSSWERAWPVVLSIEGGLSTDRSDPGNYRPDGTFIGTKYGISANAHPDVDIVNLTKEQALEIYKSQYWDAINADALPWPMCLVAFDTAVQHGVGVARQLLAVTPTPVQAYLGQRALRYFNDPNWARYGVAWGDRVRRIEDEASK
jgi:uncharacterized protein YgiM (DUF1202 family)